MLLRTFAAVTTAAAATFAKIRSLAESVRAGSSIMYGLNTHSLTTTYCRQCSKYNTRSAAVSRPVKNTFFSSVWSAWSAAAAANVSGPLKRARALVEHIFGRQKGRKTAAAAAAV